MSKIEIKDEKHLLKGLWLWDYGYNLGVSAFSDKVIEDAKSKTGLELGDWDWWTLQESNPILNWEQMIALALNILNCKATKKFVSSLYIESIPKVEFSKYEGELPIKGCSGAKRVNAYAGDYMDYSEIVGITGLMNQMKGKLPEPKEVKMDNNKFRLHGKDESCCVEGSWLDWCLFACNILASKNTKLIAPDLYATGLSNNHY
jgi:hypothetical protein